MYSLTFPEFPHICFLATRNLLCFSFLPPPTPFCSPSELSPVATPCFCKERRMERAPLFCLLYEYILVVLREKKTNNFGLIILCVFFRKSSPKGCTSLSTVVALLSYVATCDALFPSAEEALVRGVSLFSRRLISISIDFSRFSAQATSTASPPPPPPAFLGIGRIFDHGRSPTSGGMSPYGGRIEKGDVV